MMPILHFACDEDCWIFDSSLLSEFWASKFKVYIHKRQSFIGVPRVFDNQPKEHNSQQIIVLKKHNRAANLLSLRSW
jgi:hypothetical protein